MSRSKFEAKPLPYAYTALDPYISEQTLDYHHDKHYAGYVKKLNELIADTPFASMSLREIISSSEGAIFNNAAQVFNHEFYFEQLSSDGKKLPSGKLLEAINEQFASLDALCEAMNCAALQLFGSGWVWLVDEGDGTLQILSESNAGTPLTRGMHPLLTIDVWEHAYYIDYRNSRQDALSQFWHIVDWSCVEERFIAAKAVEVATGAM